MTSLAILAHPRAARRLTRGLEPLAQHRVAIATLSEPPTGCVAAAEIVDNTGRPQVNLHDEISDLTRRITQSVA